MWDFFFSKLGVTTIKSPPTNKEIVVICQSGMRSKAACKQMKKLGLNVTNVRGGMSAY